uniref:Uncharacterized protein n=1 Tax=Arundo donax TaxID=35708 RepID=A0A0A9EMU1_ARUDO
MKNLLELEIDDSFQTKQRVIICLENSHLKCRDIIMCKLSWLPGSSSVTFCVFLELELTITCFPFYRALGK